MSEELTNDLLGGMKNDGKAAAEALLELLYLAKKEGAEVTLVTLGVVVVVVVLAAERDAWSIKKSHDTRVMYDVFFLGGKVYQLCIVKCNYNYYSI